MPNNFNFKEITILGAGEAGLYLTRKLREADKNIKITLIDKTQYYFDKKKLISAFNFKEYVDLAAFSNELNISFIRDKVEKINPELKKIYFKEKEPLDFEFLVISSGLKAKDLSVKGEQREGFFYLSDIDFFQLKDLLKISTEIIVYVCTLLGLKLAFSLRSLGKDVRMLAKSLDFLANQKENVLKALSEKGINFHLDVGIEEVIGEGQIKATKIIPLKVFSSQLVLVDSGFLRNLDFFEVPLEIKNTVETVYGYIYILGDANRQNVENDYFYVNNQDDTKEQADIFSKTIAYGQPFVFQRKSLGEEDKAKIIQEICGTTNIISA
jgi:NAD(P)H-nitrite reductase large subunit